jgi:hypothetical protein
MKRKVEVSALARGQERRKNFAPGFPQEILAAETIRYLPEARSEFGMLQFMENEGMR